MTRITKLLAPVGLMLAATAAMPAQAQVDGPMATVDVVGAVFATNALRGAYEQIPTTYGQQIELRRNKAQALEALLTKFDKNKDNNIEGEEKTAMEKSPDFAQIQTLEKEIQGITNELDFARVFAIEQIIGQFDAALLEVVNAKQIKIVINPSTVIYSPPEANITQAVVTALNTKVPAVGVVPPAGWQPTRQGVQFYQQIEQLRALAQQMQAQQQATQQPGNPAAPVGR